MATNKSIIQAKYDKAHTKSFGIKLNLETDDDIIKILLSVPNKQDYIKQALRFYKAAQEKKDLVQHFAPVIGKDISEDGEILVLSDEKKMYLAPKTKKEGKR